MNGEEPHGHCFFSFWPLYRAQQHAQTLQEVCEQPYIPHGISITNLKLLPPRQEKGRTVSQRDPPAEKQLLTARQRPHWSKELLHCLQQSSCMWYLVDTCSWIHPPSLCLTLGIGSNFPFSLLWCSRFCSHTIHWETEEQELQKKKKLPIHWVFLWCLVVTAGLFSLCDMYCGSHHRNQSEILK